MDQRPYAIETDDELKLMVIRFDPVLWDDGVAQRFAHDCLAAAATMTCSPGEHLVLIDLRNAVLQSQDIYDKMKTLISAATARRIALIASAPLARMQTKRLQLRDTIVMFADIDDARAWLFDNDTRQAA